MAQPQPVSLPAHLRPALLELYAAMARMELAAWRRQAGEEKSA